MLFCIIDVYGIWRRKKNLNLALRVIGTHQRMPERLKVKQENSGCDGSFIIVIFYSYFSQKGDAHVVLGNSTLLDLCLSHILWWGFL